MTLMVYFISKIYKKEGCNIMDFLDNILKKFGTKNVIIVGAVSYTHLDVYKRQL